MSDVYEAYQSDKLSDASGAAASSSELSHALHPHPPSPVSHSSHHPPTSFVKRRTASPEMCSDAERAPPPPRRARGAVSQEVSQLEAALGAARRDAEAFASTAARLDADRVRLSEAVTGLRAELASAQQALDLQSAGAGDTEDRLKKGTAEVAALQRQLASLETTRVELKREITSSLQQADGAQQLLRAQVTPPPRHPRSHPATPAAPHLSSPPPLRAQESEREDLQREVDRLTQLLRAERTGGAQLRIELGQKTEALEGLKGKEEALRQELAMQQQALVESQVTSRRRRRRLRSQPRRRHHHHRHHHLTLHLPPPQVSSRRAESDGALLRRQLVELDMCRTQLAEANAALDAKRSELQRATAAATSAEAARERLAAQVKAQGTELTGGAQLLSAAVAEKEAAKDALAEAERTVKRLRAAADSAEASAEAAARARRVRRPTSPARRRLRARRRGRRRRRRRRSGGRRTSSYRCSNNSTSRRTTRGGSSSAPRRSRSRASARGRHSTRRARV